MSKTLIGYKLVVQGSSGARDSQSRPIYIRFSRLSGYYSNVFSRPSPWKFNRSYEIFYFLTHPFLKLDVNLLPYLCCYFLVVLLIFKGTIGNSLFFVVNTTNILCVPEYFVSSPKKVGVLQIFRSSYNLIGVSNPE